MTGEVKKAGEILKQRRLEKNLSLKEVEGATSIRMGYLEAIEEGKEDLFLSKVYMFGFMRQYAHFLELDVERLSREYSLQFDEVTENNDFLHGIETLEMRKPLSGAKTSRWNNALLWAGASLGVLFMAWCLARYLGVL